MRFSDASKSNGRREKALKRLLFNKSKLRNSFSTTKINERRNDQSKKKFIGKRCAKS